MKNSSKHASKFKSVVKKLKSAEPVLPEQRDPISVMVYAFCAWESTSGKALAQSANIAAGLEDWNDLRVSRPEELADLAGFKDARRIERSQRMPRALHRIYLREP